MNPTKKQLDLLKILNPYKERKITYDVAADILGISIRSVEDRMFRLKRRCPEVYEKFCQLRKDMNAGQRAIDRGIIMDPSKINKLNNRNQVKDQF